MTPRERDVFETIMRDVAEHNQRHIGNVRVHRVKVSQTYGSLVMGDIVIDAVELLPTGAQCA